MAMTARQRAKVSLYVQAGIFVVAVAAVIIAVDWKTVGTSVFNFAKIGPMFPDIFLVGLKNTLIYTALGFIVGLSGGLLLALMKLSSFPCTAGLPPATSSSSAAFRPCWCSSRSATAFRWPSESSGTSTSS